MKFRTKPVLIDALQWTGTNFDEMFSFIKRYVQRDDTESPPHLILRANAGAVRAEPGDWIVKADDDFHVYDPELFTQTYDPADP